ncbi:MAG TPA: hypothetical protein VFK13_05370 [Gemmatimonadaceae bacterium]|nr:hypothetical protein [Gemmatimonadaceae bacterium]
MGPAAARAVDAPGFEWRVIELPEQSLRVYVQRGTAADEDARAITDSVRRAQADVLSQLEEPPASQRPPDGESRSEQALLFFLGSRADMQRLSGRPLAGFVPPGEPTAFFVWARGYRAPLRHELAHLYTFERWGRPPAGAAATWLVEGIGAWVGGACQGHSPDALAAGLLARGALPSLASLAAEFRTLPEDVAMPAAGSLIQFLHTQEGIAGLRARWQSASGDAIPDSPIEGAWRAHVASVPPATLDIARVMREGC